MMRVIVLIGVLALAVACARQDAGKSTVPLTGRSLPPDDEEESAGNSSFFDSTYFIGYVDYFPETNEFYTAVFFKEGYEYPDESVLESKLDSVVMLEEDWGRERLPMAEAKKILLLQGLDSLDIYDSRHRLITRAYLTRVEYLWSDLDSYFIAVFRFDGPFREQTTALYGVSPDYSLFKEREFSTVEVNDLTLNKKILRKLKVDPGLDWQMRHYQVPQGTIYTVASAHALHSNKSQSFLTGIENDDLVTLNSQQNNYQFLDILPLPVMAHGRPLMLVSAGYPSSDVLWDFLAAFNGISYDVMDYNRIHATALGKSGMHK